MTEPYCLVCDEPLTWCIHGNGEAWEDHPAPRVGHEREEERGRSMKGRGIPVEYICAHCGNRFTVMQAQGGRDEDITLCWDCIAGLFEDLMEFDLED